MAPTSPSARTVAQRLLAAGIARGEAASGAGDRVAAIDEVFRRLAEELTRWFGPFGHHALLSRALAQARTSHPALDAVQIRAATDPSLDGLAESIARHGADTVIEGVETTLTAFIDLLGRLIGEDMALKLIDQSVPARGADADVKDNGGAS